MDQREAPVSIRLPANGPFRSCTDRTCRLLEAHYKTRIVGVSFAITTSGWWAWNAFLAGAYSDNISPYDIKHGFDQGFGKDPVWWLVLLAALAILLVFDLMWKSIRRNLTVSGRWPPWKAKTGMEKSAEEVDVHVWQEMEQDTAVQRRLTSLAGHKSQEIEDLDTKEHEGVG